MRKFLYGMGLVFIVIFIFSWQTGFFSMARVILADFFDEDIRYTYEQSCSPSGSKCLMVIYYAKPAFPGGASAVKRYVLYGEIVDFNLDKAEYLEFDYNAMIVVDWLDEDNCRIISGGSVIRSNELIESFCSVTQNIWAIDNFYELAR